MRWQSYSCWPEILILIAVSHGSIVKFWLQFLTVAHRQLGLLFTWRLPTYQFELHTNLLLVLLTPIFHQDCYWDMQQITNLAGVEVPLWKPFDKKNSTVV
jgi:hypothetical protein